MTDTLTLFLCGDVMTGRGIDQILPHPAPAHLYEPVVDDARHYVELAERANGPVPRPVDWAYVWGDALPEFERMAPDARIANLETAVTLSEDAARKGINYRMNPANAPVLGAAGLDVCTLANNHVLDWGDAGLHDTLDTLAGQGIAACGAGRNAGEAARPAVLDLGQRGRVLVIAAAHGSSGVPPDWAARADRPGVYRLPDLSDRTARELLAGIEAWRRHGDVVVVSLHWGGNWGFEVPAEQTGFARTLIDGGVAVVHGHSAHHAKAFERYRGGLICTGTGDFLTDYEGIPGTGGFRDDLVLMVWPEIDVARGTVRSCTLTPLKLARMRLNRPADADRDEVCGILARESAAFATDIRVRGDGRFEVVPRA